MRSENRPTYRFLAGAGLRESWRYRKRASRGSGVTDQGITEEGKILHVQAWVCYPSTVPAHVGPVVPSMLVGPTAAMDLTGSPVPIFGSSQVSDHQNPGPSYTRFTLDNTWPPQPGDIIPPNTDVHNHLATSNAQIVANEGKGLQRKSMR